MVSNWWGANRVSHCSLPLGCILFSPSLVAPLCVLSLGMLSSSSERRDVTRLVFGMGLFFLGACALVRTYSSCLGLIYLRQIFWEGLLLLSLGADDWRLWRRCCPPVRRFLWKIVNGWEEKEWDQIQGLCFHLLWWCFRKCCSGEQSGSEMLFWP